MSGGRLLVLKERDEASSEQNRTENIGNIVHSFDDLCFEAVQEEWWDFFFVLQEDEAIHFVRRNLKLKLKEEESNYQLSKLD